MFVLITFRSRNDALAVREILANFGLALSVIDSPRQLSASCSLAIKIRGLTGQKVRNIIMAKSIENHILGVYEVYEEGRTKRYVRV